MAADDKKTGSDGILLPRDIAQKAEEVGLMKARMAPARLIVLAVLAGSYIGLGGMAATTIWTGMEDVPFGLMRMAGGIGFTLGLVLVVLGGVELFTGNVLMMMAVAGGRMGIWTLMRAWSFVLVGNIAGALAIALLVFFAGHHLLDNGGAGRVSIAIATAKADIPFVRAFFLGVLCNALVCLAIYLCYGAASTADKILVILLPIATFVAAGFEHSIANVYFFAQALLIDTLTVGIVDASAGTIDVEGIIGNLLPVILGNIVGGGVLVGLVYWFVNVYSVRK